MKKNVQKICLRTATLCIEAVAVVAVLLSIMAGIALWRLSSGPLDVSFAKNYIQQALRNDEQGTYAGMDGVVLHWPDLRGPLLLGLKSAKVFGPEGEIIVSVDEAALSLSRSRLLIGQIAPVAIILKKPSLHVIRDHEGINFGFTAPGQDETAAREQESLIAKVLQYIARPGMQYSEESPLATLEGFRIEEAVLHVNDQIIGASWNIPDADINFESGDEGLAADFAIVLPDEIEEQDERGSEEKPAGEITGRVSYDWDNEDLTVNGEALRIKTRMLADKFPDTGFLSDLDTTLNIKFEAALDSDFAVQGAVIQLLAPEGTFLLPDFSADKETFRNFSAQLSYNAGDKRIEIAQARISIKEATIEGRAELALLESAFEGSIVLSLKELEQKHLAPVWPARFIEDDSKEWLVDRMADGTFKDVEASMRLTGQKAADGTWTVRGSNKRATFAFENMTIDYRSPLTSLTLATGSGVYDDEAEKLNVNLDGAQIGDIAITEAELEISDIVAEGKGKADIFMKLEGPLQSLMRYLQTDPLNVESPFNVDLVEGRAALKVNLGFPTVGDLKTEDVDLNVRGGLLDVKLPDVIRALNLTGGPFTLKVEDGIIDVEGQGALDGQPVTLHYRDFIDGEGKPYRNKITASITVSEAMRRKLDIDLSTFLEGPVRADIEYIERNDGTANAEVNADLEQARLFFDAFDYEKLPGKRGSATFTALLQGELLTDIRNLTASAPGLTLENTELLFRQVQDGTELSYGKSGQFTLEETVGSFEFEITPQGLAKIVLDGQFLDLRPFLENQGESKEYDDPPMQISVSVDRMRTTDEETVQYGKIYVDIDPKGRINQLEMDAIAGAGDVYLRYKPDAEGMRTFRLEADDAGAALRAFGVYDQIQGGKLVIYAEPIRGVYDRNLIGAAEITNFKVTDAPSLAQLLNALSLIGLLELLDGDGLNFAKLEADFDWLYRSQGSLLVLKDGATSGSSLGLTFDGVFDNAEGTVDVSGTIIPLSGVNKVISSIPLIGDILTGGSGVFAATYKIRGEASDPQISVNPLSVLAPGIFRKIFFE